MLQVLNKPVARVELDEANWAVCRVDELPSRTLNNVFPGHVHGQGLLATALLAAQATSTRIIKSPEGRRSGLRQVDTIKSTRSNA